MRLLNTRTLTLTTFIGEVPTYVILSHRWEEEELIFEDVMKEPISNISSPARAKRGFSKVQGTCALAIKDGFDWVWIDSCCIDKSSSAELQEAINSMFRWYQESQICYAYLSDVPDGQAGCDVAFEQSLWFTRGWTLQELLAPCSVEFYAANWMPIGSKAARAYQIACITGIDIMILKNGWDDLKDNYSAAEKMSWAAHRLVTRTEDMAYCLLGLFDANMPLLYGEGGCKAFRRLQQVVFESEADYTLFLFSSSGTRSAPLLAQSVEQFCTKVPCEGCQQKRECLPRRIHYMQMRPSLDTRWEALGDRNLKLIKGGVQLRVPHIEYKPSLEIHSLSPCQNTPERMTGRSIALLPLTLIGYEYYVFGILLTRQPAQPRYFRYHEAPILVNTTGLLDIDFKPEALIVSDQSTGARHAEKYLCFEFHSSSFGISSWNSTTHNPTHFSRSMILFAVSMFASERFALTIRTSNTFSTISPTILLGDCICGLRLEGVELEGDGRPTSRVAPAEDSLTERMTIPLVSAQGYINVALRRLCDKYSSGPGHGTAFIRYRVDMERVGDNVELPESGKMGTNIANELPVYAMATDEV